MILVKPGVSVPIYIVLENSAVGRLIRVEIINPVTAESLATLFPEDVVGRPGHYSDTSFTMPVLSNILALVYTYEEDGTTVAEEDAIPICAKENPPASIQNYTDLVAQLDDEPIIAYRKTNMTTVIRGSDRKIRIVLKTATQEPLDLTLCTAVKATFLNEDGEYVTRTLADDQIEIVEPVGSGVIVVTLAKAFTAVLKKGERQDFQINLTIAGEEIIHLFQGVLIVMPALGEE